MGVGVLRGTALALSVALGVAAGAATAYVTSGEETAGADPLGLGIELVNQSCSGDNLILLARGSSRPALRAVVVENPGAHYLEVDASCPAVYAPLDQPAPEYVVYLGPYDDTGAACGRKMTVEHRGDPVTSLNPGNQTYVKCPCELSTATWPTLTPGMGRPDALEGMWIHQLQAMLVDLGRLENDVDETGYYDEKTMRIVRQVQDAELLDPTGVVDQPTWEVLRDRACRTYEDY